MKPKKPVLVNQKPLFVPKGSVPPTGSPGISETFKSLDTHRAASRQRARSGGENLELFPTAGYVFSSKEMQEFMDIWNGVFVLPKIVSMRGRENRVRAAMQDEFFRNNYREGIRRVAASRFCRGANRQGTGRHPWRATVDWFLQLHVLPRVLEGMYDDDKEPTVTKSDQQFDIETL